jgi:hypothetical protein
MLRTVIGTRPESCAPTRAGGRYYGYYPGTEWRIPAVHGNDFDLVATFDDQVTSAENRPGFGFRTMGQSRAVRYRRLRVLLQREPWEVGKERFYRMYTEEGLALRRKRPRRHATAVHREQRRPAFEMHLAKPVDPGEIVASMAILARRVNTKT